MALSSACYIASSNVSQDADGRTISIAALIQQNAGHIAIGAVIVSTFAAVAALSTCYFSIRQARNDYNKSNNMRTAFMQLDPTHRAALLNDGAVNGVSMKRLTDRWNEREPFVKVPDLSGLDVQVYRKRWESGRKAVNFEAQRGTWGYIGEWEKMLCVEIERRVQLFSRHTTDHTAVISTLFPLAAALSAVVDSPTIWTLSDPALTAPKESAPQQSSKTALTVSARVAKKSHKDRHSPLSSVFNLPRSFSPQTLPKAKDSGSTSALRRELIESPTIFAVHSIPCSLTRPLDSSYLCPVDFQSYWTLLRSVGTEWQESSDGRILYATTFWGKTSIFAVNSVTVMRFEHNRLLFGRTDALAVWLAEGPLPSDVPNMVFDDTEPDFPNAAVSQLAVRDEDDTSSPPMRSSPSPGDSRPPGEAQSGGEPAKTIPRRGTLLDLLESDEQLESTLQDFHGMHINYSGNLRVCQNLELWVSDHFGDDEAETKRKALLQLEAAAQRPSYGIPLMRWLLVFWLSHPEVVESIDIDTLRNHLEDITVDTECKRGPGPSGEANATEFFKLYQGWVKSHKHPQTADTLLCRLLRATCIAPLIRTIPKAASSMNLRGVTTAYVG